MTYAEERKNKEKLNFYMQRTKDRITELELKKQLKHNEERLWLLDILIDDNKNILNLLFRNI